MTSRRFSITRSHYLVALLLLVLGLAGVLAYEALSAARSQQVTAERALTDHATFAAWRYVGRAEGKLDWVVAAPGLKYVEKAAHNEWDVPEEVAAEYRWLMRYAFTVKPNGLGVEIHEGKKPSAKVIAWIEDEIAKAIPGPDPEWSYSIVSGAPDGVSRIIVYTVERDREERAIGVTGFEASPHAIRTALGYAYDGALLPPALTEGTENAAMTAVRVMGPAGDVLFDSTSIGRVSDNPDERAGFSFAPDEPLWRFSADDNLPQGFGGLDVRVAIRPEMAETLIIGGLPKSRLPLIVALLLLTGLVVTAAIVLMRREMELGRLRTEFVSNVSHELRTPLAQIRMFVETLLLGRVRSDDERLKSLKIMNREIRRLGNLVENILTFSRAERGGNHLTMERTELAPLFAEVVDTFRPLASGRDMALVTDIEDGAVATVDPGAVKQILLNLLDNAVKYGPAGQTVSLGLDEVNGAVVFHVDDEGPGVPPESRQTVWDSFVRLDRESEAATAGTGIGLSVVRELVEQHGGHAWVETGASGGARFCVEIPREPTSKTADAA